MRRMVPRGGPARRWVAPTLRCGMQTPAPSARRPLIDRTSDVLASRLPVYYGYVMVPVAMLLSIASSPGQTFAFSAFTPSFRDELGLSDVRLTLAYAVGTLLAAVPLSRIGPLSDRIGLRVVVLGSLMALSVVCVAASRVQGFVTLLLAFWALRFLGQGSMGLLSGNTVSMWFRRRIGRVGAVMAVAMAGAFAVVPGLIQSSIADVGWRATYVRIGFVVAMVGLPIVLLLYRNRPEDVRQMIDGTRIVPDAQPEDAPEASELVDVSVAFADAVRHRSFWAIGAVTTLWAMVGTAVMFYLYPIAAAGGVDADRAGELFAWFGTFMLAGQLVGGVAADSMRINRLLAIGTMMLAGGTAAIAAALVDRHALPSPEWLLRSFAALFGGGQGLLIAVTSAAWVKFYGRDELGRIRGAVWSATVAGSGLGPLILGATVQYGGTFTPALVAMAVGLAAVVPVSMLATPPEVGPEVESATR